MRMFFFFIMDGWKKMFYLWLYGRTSGEKPFRKRQRKPIAVTSWIIFDLQIVILYMHYSTDKNPVVVHWLEQVVSQWALSNIPINLVPNSIVVVYGILFGGIHPNGSNVLYTTTKISGKLKLN